MPGRVGQPSTACHQESCEFKDHPAISSPETQCSLDNPGLIKTNSSHNHHLGHSISTRDSFQSSSQAYQTLMPLWSICPPVFREEGHMSSQTDAFPPGCFQHPDHSTSDDPAGTTITRKDSGVGLSEPLQQEHQDIQVCGQPETCELSPDMSQALRRFSIPHKCKFVEAKRELVDKVRIFGVVCFLHAPRCRSMS